MPKKDKGFSKLNHEAIELNTFHESESDDEVGMRMATPSSDCGTCGLTRSRWSIVMTIVVASLLVSCLFLFLYFAYRDSQLTNRLNELEAKISSSSSSHEQTSEASGLVAKMDELTKRLNDTTKMLLQRMGEVNDDCRAVVNNQTQFVVSKTEDLNGALKQVKETQKEVEEAKHSMASLLGTMDKYDTTITGLSKSHGDLQLTLDKLKDNMGQISTNMATLKAELKGLEVTAQNHTDKIANLSSYCHQHVDLLHDHLGSVNVSMTTNMSSMTANISSMATEISSMTTQMSSMATQMSSMSTQISFMGKNMSLNSLSTNSTADIFDTIVPLLSDPMFISNLTSAISLIVDNFNWSTILPMMQPLLNMSIPQESGEDFSAVDNFNWSTILPMLQPLLNMSIPQESGEDFSAVTKNLTKVWEQVDMLKEGLQQVNSSLQILTSRIHVGFLPTPSPTDSITNTTEIVPTASGTTNSSSSSSAETGDKTVSAEETVSPSDDEDTSSTGDVIATFSAPATIVSIPSPSTQVAPLPHLDASTVISLSSAVGVEVISTSSVSVMVTPVASNKTASLLKGIHALEEFLQLFDTLDKDDDSQLTIDESGLSQSLFNMLDSDKDSFITRGEIQAHIAYLQIELDSLLHDGTADNVTVNTTSSVAEVSTNNTEPPSIEATPTVTATSDNQATEDVTSTTKPFDMSSNVVPLSTSASSTSPVTVTPISTNDELMAELQESLGDMT